MRKGTYGQSKASSVRDKTYISTFACEEESAFALFLTKWNCGDKLKKKKQQLTAIDQWKKVY